MTTECTTERLEFGGLRRQRVVGRFDGGELGSDGGGLLLRELAQRTGLFGRLSACFRDYREPQRTRHAVEVLVAARVLGLALGYEDLNDHDTLRQSKLWSLLCGAAGRGRRKASWEALPPGKSTLNRLELTGPALDAGERYKKIVADTARLDALLVDLFLDWHGEQPERIVLDVDATDDPLHGRQEGRFNPGQRAGRAAVVRRGLSGSGSLRAGAGPPPEPTAAQLATALQAIVSSPAGVRRDHCVHRAGGAAEPAATPSLLAALTKHLHGFAAPPYDAMLSSHSKRIKPLRIYDS